MVGYGIQWGMLSGIKQEVVTLLLEFPVEEECWRGKKKSLPTFTKAKDKINTCRVMIQRRNGGGRLAASCLLQQNVVFSRHDRWPLPWCNLWVITKRIKFIQPNLMDLFKHIVYIMNSQAKMVQGPLLCEAHDCMVILLNGLWNSS